MRPTRWRLLIVLLPLLTAGTADPGLLLDLDLAQYALTARDLRHGVTGPTLRVVTGSPAHPTPVGVFPIFGVVRNPAWDPGETARGLGAERVPASADGPLGVAKIAFARDGIALHGGADPLLLGKPVSLGCVRALDSDMLALLDWLEERGGLLGPRAGGDGERHQGFRRPARIRVH
jgi:lipoprotein-anchoring transpeptidase ErfK/SrfK